MDITYIAKYINTDSIFCLNNNNLLNMQFVVQLYQHVYITIDLKIYVRGLRLQLCGMSHRQLQKLFLVLD